ncbi:50S ribosomal protein L13 [uncultured archaeon]|nr:50S ribosomal protein L13 [uncultured archaeon]
MIIVDGTNMVLGRLASNIAKKLMRGEEVHLINAEKIVVSGIPGNIVGDYMQKRRLQQKATPEFSPKWPKVPHLMVRRVIRGMLPFKKAKGKAAFKKLRVYAGNPNLKGESAVFEDAKNKGFSKYMSIGDVCRRLGANW